MSSGPASESTGGVRQRTTRRDESALGVAASQIEGPTCASVGSADASQATSASSGTGVVALSSACSRTWASRAATLTVSARSCSSHERPMATPTRAAPLMRSRVTSQDASAQPGFANMARSAGATGRSACCQPSLGPLDAAAAARPVPLTCGMTSMRLICSPMRMLFIGPSTSGRCSTHHGDLVSFGAFQLQRRRGRDPAPGGGRKRGHDRGMPAARQPQTCACASSRRVKWGSDGVRSARLGGPARRCCTTPSSCKQRSQLASFSDWRAAWLLGGAAEAEECR